MQSKGLDLHRKELQLLLHTLPSTFSVFLSSWSKASDSLGSFLWPGSLNPEFKAIRRPRKTHLKAAPNWRFCAQGRAETAPCPSKLPPLPDGKRTRSRGGA